MTDPHDPPPYRWIEGAEPTQGPIPPREPGPFSHKRPSGASSQRAALASAAALLEAAERELARAADGPDGYCATVARMVRSHVQAERARVERERERLTRLAPPSSGPFAGA